MADMMDEKDLMTDDQIDAVLTMLDEKQEKKEQQESFPVGEGVSVNPAEPVYTGGAEEALQAEEVTSPTLAALDRNRRPTVRTACEHCPNSMWFATPAETKCYCRAMYLVVWSSKEPSQITHCDGPFLG